MNTTNEPRERERAMPVVEPSVRGERVFKRLDGVTAWIDGLLGRLVPAEMNPLIQAGRAANFALLVAVVSGVALLVWYSPSVQFAYSSVESLQGRTLGGWVRAIHRYSSDLLMLLLFIHAGRMFVARKFAGARWLPWISGVGLMTLVWFIGWTGYWLVWDQPAQQVAATSMRLLDDLPIFGESLSRLYLADRLVPSLLFFVVFFLHMLLPLGMAIGLVVHLLRLNRIRLVPSWPMCVAMLIGLGVASLVAPAPLDETARMAVKAESFTVDAWYLTPLALGLRLQSGGLWLALFGTMAVGGAIPWLFGRKRKTVTYQTVVDVSRCHACTQCVQDCPYDAVSMVPRTDGKPFESQAWVDPQRCVGCAVCVGSCDSEAMTLPWFDAVREEASIEQEFERKLALGDEPWIALIASELDGALGMLAAARWRERLPEYQVFMVPTASWIRPKFVERLFKRGAEGVLIARDARGESAARDGNQWVSARLAGDRKPVFRPSRAEGKNNWLVVDYDPSRPVALLQAAKGFRKGECHGVYRCEEFLNTKRLPQKLIGGTALALALVAAAVVPSHLVVKNPAPMEPEFVFSFKALGAYMEPDAASIETEDLDKPVHMRGRSTQKPHRAPVVARLSIDGETVEKEFQAKGISKDGPAIGEWRVFLEEGPHAVTIRLERGEGAESLEWTGIIEAERGRLHVVTYEPQEGFRLE